MAERNLIREGFVYNTRNSSGTISGTQIVTPGEINSLVDGNTITTALLISGTKNIVLDADLGARWKLDRIELYTNEASSSNFEIEISDNNLDYTQLTVAGSAGLWTATLDSTVVSGSPRYIRYRHHPSSNTLVQEWLAINDETLVDFGSDGSQTALVVDDAPIGRASEFSETLTIKNNHTKSAEAFAFVDRTFNQAEDEIEISISPNGPWFGRNTGLSNQPETVSWERGTFFNTRVVPSGIALFEFSGGDTKGWLMSGATLTATDNILRGTTTTQTPLVYASSEFVPHANDETFATARIRHANKFVFRAADAAQVKVRAKVQTPISVSNLLEGPRLFWKTEEDVESSPEIFRNTLSTLSTFGNSPFTGQTQEFVFDVSTVPTWSGVVRGLGFRPFTVATGTNLIFDFIDTEVLPVNGNAVVLDLNPVNSGTFALPFDSDSITTSGTKIVVSTRHRILQDCIITKVGMLCTEEQGPQEGLCLARLLPGNVFPSIGTNFSVSYAVELGHGIFAGNQPAFQEVEVFWAAKKDDFICAFSNTIFGVAFIPGEAGDSFSATAFSGTSNLSTLEGFTSRLNTNPFTATSRHYQIFYEAISPASLGYKASGLYRSPIMDVGQSPSLAMVDFDVSTPAGTSIDTLGQSGFDSIRARANDRPPVSSLALGETGVVSGTNNRTLGLLLNEQAISSDNPDHPFQLNTPNISVPIGTQNPSTSLLNVGAAILYNENRDEIWVLNNVISGTNPFVTSDARPIWDVFSPETGDYIRTDAVKGNLFYGFDDDATPFTSTNRFTPLGFVSDYAKDEVYIIANTPCFTLGAGRYYALVLDTAGNLKDVAFRSGALGIITEQEDDIFERARTVGYHPNIRDSRVTNVNRSGVFFLIHDVAGTSEIQGQKFSTFRNGDDVSPRNNQLINTTFFSAVSGLGFTSSVNFGVKGIAFNSVNDKLFILFDNLTGASTAANRKPELLTLNASFNSDNLQVECSVATASGTAFNTAPTLTGFSKADTFEVADTNELIITPRQHAFSMGMTYNSKRDTLNILRSYIGLRTPFYPEGGASILTNRVFQKSLSFIFECGAGNNTRIDLPSIASTRDPLWGTVSGTLAFDDIASEGVNFPTGRYVQVEYQLNSNTNQTATPALLTSKIAQGLRLGQISAGGTKDFYVRTNITEDSTIGDQQGRLKIFLESVEG